MDDKLLFLNINEMHYSSAIVSDDLLQGLKVPHVVPMPYNSPARHVLIYDFINLKYVISTAYILVEKSGNKYGSHIFFWNDTTR